MSTNVMSSLSVLHQDGSRCVLHGARFGSRSLRLHVNKAAIQVRCLEDGLEALTLSLFDKRFFVMGQVKANWIFQPIGF